MIFPFFYTFPRVFLMFSNFSLAFLCHLLLCCAMTPALLPLGATARPVLWQLELRPVAVASPAGTGAAGAAEPISSDVNSHFTIVN